MRLKNPHITIDNIISGIPRQASDGSFFKVTSPFKEYEGLYTVRVANSTKEDLESAITSAKKSFEDCQSLSLEERKDILDETAHSFSLSKQELRALSTLYGMPIHKVMERVDKSKELMKIVASDAYKKLSGMDKPSERIALALIPANDLLEYAYIVGIFGTAGIPVVLKPSGREPIVGERLVKEMYQNGYPAGGFNVINFDTRDSSRSKFAEYLIREVDIAILMGNPEKAKELLGESNTKAVIFGADNTKTIIDESADLENTVKGTLPERYWPGSCLSTKFYYTVGEKVTDYVLKKLKKEYKSADSLGRDILDENTKIGLVSEGTLDTIIGFLEIPSIFGQIELVYPQNMGKLSDDKTKPVLVKNLSLPYDSPLITNPLAAYFTCVCRVNSISEAIEHINESAKNYPTKKSMAVAIYGVGIELIDTENSIVQLADGTSREISAYEIDINKSPMGVQGMTTVHQGIDLAITLFSSY